MKKYLLIPSYPSALSPFVFKESGDSIHVLSGGPLCSFFEDMDLPCTRIPQFQLTLKRPSDFFRFKRWIATLLSTTKQGDELHFFASTYAVCDYILATQWNRQVGKCYFYAAEDSQFDYPRIRRRFPASLQELKHIANLLSYRFFFNMDLASVFTEGHWVPAIDDRFFQENRIEIVALSSDWQKTKKNAMRKICERQVGCDILLATEDLVADGYVDKESLYSLYKRILELPMDVKTKTHPTLKNDVNNFDKQFFTSQGAHLYNDYIPAEFLLPNAECIVATVSTTLNSATLLDKKLVISLIDIVSWKSESIKSEFKTKLMKSHQNDQILSKIRFPATIQELMNEISCFFGKKRMGKGSEITEGRTPHDCEL